MRVVIFGAGAVGGHLAARLAAHGPAAGIEVAAVARGAQLAAMNQRGITLWIGEERTSASIHATDRPETLGHQDVVLVTLKSSVLPAAASQLRTLIGPETTVVFAMNGVPWWYLYRLDDGGVPRPDLSRLDPGALPGEPIAVLGRHPELFALAKGLMREGLAVCAAYGIHIDLDPERAYGARPTSTHKSSMLQDFERHRPPEIDGLLTAVQAFARAAQVPTPHLDAVTALVIAKARMAGLYPGTGSLENAT